MPIRGNSKSHRSMVGRIISTKAVGAATFESSLERDFLEILDFDEDVREFEVQPLRVHFKDATGAMRHYTPDVFVAWVKGIPWLCEVKFRVDLFKNWSDLKPRFKAARQYCREEGWEFRILTEKEIRTPLLENVRFLRRYIKGTQRAEENLCTWIINTIESAGPMLAGKLIESMTDDKMTRGFLIYAMWQLVAQRRVYADLRSQHVSMNTRIYLDEPDHPE